MNSTNEIDSLIETVIKQFKDYIKMFMMFSILIVLIMLSYKTHSLIETALQVALLLFSLLICGGIIFKNINLIKSLSRKKQMYEEAQQQGLSRIAPNQEAADAEVETESVTLEQVAAFEEEIKSLKTKLAEKEEIINKSGWKKWYLAACSAMGEIIRENTVNSSSPVTIKRDAFFERIKLNYPDQNEKEFGSAYREAWKCVPDTVKHTDGSS